MYICFCLKGRDVYLKRIEGTNGRLPPTHFSINAQMCGGNIEAQLRLEIEDI